MEDFVQNHPWHSKCLQPAFGLACLVTETQRRGAPLAPNPAAAAASALRKGFLAVSVWIQPKITPHTLPSPPKTLGCSVKPSLPQSPQDLGRPLHRSRAWGGKYLDFFFNFSDQASPWGIIPKTWGRWWSKRAPVRLDLDSGEGVFLLYSFFLPWFQRGGWLLITAPFGYQLKYAAVPLFSFISEPLQEVPGFGKVSPIPQCPSWEQCRAPSSVPELPGADVFFPSESLQAYF